MIENPRGHIIGIVGDLVANFLWYDRKGDEDLPRGVIEDEVAKDPKLVDDIIEKFATSLREQLNG